MRCQTSPTSGRWAVVLQCVANCSLASPAPCGGRVLCSGRLHESAITATAGCLVSGLYACPTWFNPGLLAAGTAGQAMMMP